ncbi:hypothetical protein J1TS5_09790 [Paenibacillus macerans]|uniref:hypothetical protein n=1 Tax=Paenibacillus macerans TaxID=44252 RepID=UPI001B2F2E6D|nr:hypothetical protein [Paenibacillus macerans]GIP08809.1 hypothetical protein J1TS5_09790 [Paenibacillus macerans]
MSALISAAPILCQKCRKKHDPQHPHNQDSLYWKFTFFEKHGRWPTWTDAMEHCSDEVKSQWIKVLKQKGIEVS